MQFKFLNHTIEVYVKLPFIHAMRGYCTAREATPRECKMNSRCMNKRQFKNFKPREQKTEWKIRFKVTFKFKNSTVLNQLKGIRYFSLFNFIYCAVCNILFIALFRGKYLLNTRFIVV